MTSNNEDQSKIELNRKHFQPISSDKLVVVEDKRSPQCRCIKTVLKVLELPYEVRNVESDCNDERLIEVKKLNPRGKIPILVDRGFCLSERYHFKKCLVLNIKLIILTFCGKI